MSKTVIRVHLDALGNSFTIYRLGDEPFLRIDEPYSIWLKNDEQFTNGLPSIKPRAQFLAEQTELPKFQDEEEEKELAAQESNPEYVTMMVRRDAVGAAFEASWSSNYDTIDVSLIPAPMGEEPHYGLHVFLKNPALPLPVELRKVLEGAPCLFRRLQ